MPSLQELGYKVNVENMKGLMIPAKTPEPIARYLVESFRAVIEGPRRRLPGRHGRDLKGRARVETRLTAG